MLAPCFQGPRWRTFRLVVFVVTGLSGLAPIVHGIHMFGFAQMVKQSGLPYYFAEGGLFLIGAVTYACRFPERIKPGTFDIFGSSHQIFHILVMIATLVHLVDGYFIALDETLQREKPDDFEAGLSKLEYMVVTVPDGDGDSQK
ncbi:hypothetical protein NUW58_g2198 [Xylaria curta]|uniref:Uncharacterized protein n=1 Tax=Xylaria curta TaxID=42375 RepID=A0ACC1PH96_9PEZI|nr:hypothetical protein NUW58_g2198 [Xylaria curta]